MDAETFLAKYAHVVTHEWEARFVRDVLARVPGLDFADVVPQHSFRDSRGRSRYVDFAIMSAGARVAIEVDGFNKAGVGAMTQEGWVDWSVRETSLVALGWTVLRFANARVRDDAVTCAREVATVLASARLSTNGADRGRAGPHSVGPPPARPSRPAPAARPTGWRRRRRRSRARVLVAIALVAAGALVRARGGVGGPGAAAMSMRGTVPAVPEGLAGGSCETAIAPALMPIYVNRRVWVRGRVTDVQEPRGPRSPYRVTLDGAGFGPSGVAVTWVQNAPVSEGWWVCAFGSVDWYRGHWQLRVPGDGFSRTTPSR